MIQHPHVAISLALLLCSAAGAAGANNAAMLRCRALVDTAQRLQCYDAIVVAAPGAAGADVATAATAATTLPAPAPALPQAQRQQLVENFGLPVQAPELLVQDIESRISGAFLGWRSNTRITLANGQVWQVVDDSVGVINANAPKVKIRRGAMGAYYLELEGSNRSPRVKRVQ